MNKNFDQLSLPSDLYSRNVLIAEGIAQYKRQHGLETVQVLDVGGRSGRLSGFLDEGDQLTILDIREGNDPNLIVGDGTDMHMFRDDQFDVVVSGDVFEHVPPAKREAFVSEAVRVAKGLVVLAAPFDRPGVHEAEKMVNDYFHQQMGKDHQWLQEHLEHGLPDPEELEGFLKAQHWQFTAVASNDLDNWVLLQLLIFYAYSYGVPDHLINRFYRAYNRDLFAVEDFRLGGYRQVYFISQDGFVPEFTYQLDQEKRRGLRQQAFALLGSFSKEQRQAGQEKDTRLHRDIEKIQQLEAMLSEGEFKRSALEELLREREEDLHQLRKGVDEQNVLVKELASQVHLKENHIRDQNMLISQKDADLLQQIEEIKKRDASIADLNTQIHDKVTQVRDLEQLAQEKDQRLEKFADRIREKNAFIQEVYGALTTTREQRDSLRKASLRKQARLMRLKNALRDRNAQLSDAKVKMEVLEEDLQLSMNALDQQRTLVEQMSPDYHEFQAVKRSLSYRFLSFHRRITGAVARFWRDVGSGLRLLREQGWRSFWKQLKWYFARQKASDAGLSLNEQYERYLIQHRLTDERLEAMRQECEQFEYQPVISIITPVYNVDPKWINKCIQSVLGQLYPHWELCLHDDGSSNSKTLACLQQWEGKDERIKISYGKENLHISGASNQALKMATGEFIGLLDNDDELTIDALYEMVKMINIDPELDMLYSDEDKLDMKGRRIDPHFKPDWSPETFESMMYSCHFGVYRRSLIEEIGGFRMGLEGSQDYDLVLRVTEQTDRIVHIPKVLYHWRMIPGSAAATTDAKSYAYEAAQKALLDRLLRQHQEGRVHQSLWTGSYRMRRALVEHPLVSIIIPFKDKPGYLRRCLTSVLQSRYKHLEILLVSNNSEEDETFAVMETFHRRDDRIRLLTYNKPFNFSAINNWATKQSKGEYLLFLNNDTEVIAEDWVEALLEQAMREPVGAVGAKLLYPNDTIQHAGVILGINGVANHAFRHMPADWHGYFGYANVIRNYSAVTAACMMVQKQKFWEAGGFEEEHLAVAYNDVDLCLKLMQQGYRNVYTPFAQLYHFESVSRECDKSAPCSERFQAEAQYMMQQWGELIANDPYYNPNLTRQREDFSLRV